MEEIIISIIKKLLPTVETIVIADLKPEVLSILKTRLAIRQIELSDLEIAKLHAHFGTGLWKDETAIIALTVIIDGLTWAIEQVTAYQLPTQEA